MAIYASRLSVSLISIISIISRSSGLLLGPVPRYCYFTLSRNEKPGPCLCYTTQMGAILFEPCLQSQYTNLRDTCRCEHTIHSILYCYCRSFNGLVMPISLIYYNRKYPWLSMWVTKYSLFQPKVLYSTVL